MVAHHQLRTNPMPVFKAERLTICDDRESEAEAERKHEQYGGGASFHTSHSTSITSAALECTGETRTNLLGGQRVEASKRIDPMPVSGRRASGYSLMSALFEALPDVAVRTRLTLCCAAFQVFSRWSSGGSISSVSAGCAPVPRGRSILTTSICQQDVLLVREKRVERRR